MPNLKQTTLSFDRRPSSATPPAKRPRPDPAQTTGASSRASAPAQCSAAKPPPLLPPPPPPVATAAPAAEPQAASDALAAGEAAEVREVSGRSFSLKVWGDGTAAAGCGSPAGVPAATGVGAGDERGGEACVSQPAIFDAASAAAEAEVEAEAEPELAAEALVAAVGAAEGEGVAEAEVASPPAAAREATPAAAAPAAEGEAAEGEAAEGEAAEGEAEEGEAEGGEAEGGEVAQSQPEAAAAASETAVLEAEVSGLSEYEKERLRNIEENQRILASLGLAEPLVQRPKPKPPRRRRALPPPPPPRSTRSLRSSGARGGEAGAARVAAGREGVGGGGGGKGQEEGEEEAEEEAEEVAYDDSAVLQYVVEGHQGAASSYASSSSSTAAAAAAAAASSSSSSPPPPPSDTPLLGWSESAVQQVALPERVYSADYAQRGQLLAAAGGGGMVTVLGMPGQAGGECAELLSFKGHKGWVGNVQFAGDQRLLSAANDGQLVLWDLSKARGGRPRLISQLEPQSGGIFAMHEAGGRVLTASKDGTVALSMLADDCLRPGASWDELHSGVIKSVCWRDGNVFASAGRGGNLRVVDVRAGGGGGGGSGGGGGALDIEGAHDRDAICVRWQPRAGDPSAGLLLSAGYDLQIKLWDARAPSRPLHTLQGHVAPRVARQKGIFQPQFCAGGRYVVASGEGSEALSLYSAESGATLSRGRIGCTASTLSWCESRRQLGVATGKTLRFFEPRLA